MTPSSFSFLILVVAMGASTAARADNADIDVPGPIGRSSISVSGDYSRSNFDYTGPAGQSLGGSRSTSKSGGLTAALSVHERVDITVVLARSVYRQQSTYNGTPSNYSGASNSGGLGVAVRPWGTATGMGFGLSTGLSAYRSEGGGSETWRLSLLPQYRFSPDWLGVLELDTLRSGGYRSHGASASLVWKLTPDLSLIPGAGWSYREPDGYSRGGEDYSFDLAAFYHLSRELSLHAAAYGSRSPDDHYTYESVTRQRSYGTSFGVRWTF